VLESFRGSPWQHHQTGCRVHLAGKTSEAAPPQPIEVLNFSLGLSPNAEETMEDRTKEFELSIWRPARFGRTIEYLERSPGEFERSRLLEQIYAWDPGPIAPWNSILDSQKSSQLRDAFVEKFAPNLPPNERSIQILSEFVDSMRRALAEPNSSCWNDLPLPATESGDAPSMRCDLARAFLLHLDWVTATFAHVPDASVTVR